MVATGCLLSASLILSACSSSGSDGSADGDKKLDAAAEACVSDAKDVIKPFEEFPTTLPEEYTPLSKAPEPGKKIIYLALTLPFDQQVAKGIKSAAEAVGWDAEVITFSATVEDLNAKLAQAIAEKPDVISFAGYPLASFQQMADAAKEAGIIIIDSSVPDVPTSTTGFAGTSKTPSSYAQWGELDANWVMQDSGCDANVAMFTLPYPIWDSTRDAFQKSFDTGCPDCKFTWHELQAEDYGTPAATAAMVSAIQADPSIKYVGVTVGDLAQGLVPALAQAGITDVKVFGHGPAPADYEALKNGTEHMFMTAPPAINAWLTVDAALRVMDTNKPFTGFIAPTAMLTTDNVPDDASDETAVYPENYQDLFKEVWKVG